MNIHLHHCNAAKGKSIFLFIGLRQPYSLKFRDYIFETGRRMLVKYVQHYPARLAYFPLTFFDSSKRSKNFNCETLRVLAAPCCIGFCRPDPGVWQMGFGLVPRKGYRTKSKNTEVTAKVYLLPLPCTSIFPFAFFGYLIDGGFFVKSILSYIGSIRFISTRMSSSL